MGFTNYYCKFIPKYTQIEHMEPLIVKQCYDQNWNRKQASQVSTLQ